MKKRIIIYFLLLLGSIWLGVQIAKNPGYVFISLQKWSVETTTWLFILILILAFLLLHLLLNFIKGITNFPRRIGNWRRARREHKSIQLLNKGYLDLLRGDNKSAEKKLVKGAKNQSLSFLNYMIAAEAANLQQATKERDYYLLQARKTINKDSYYLVDVAYIQFLLENLQPEQALTEIVRLRTEYPKDLQLLRLLTRSYLQLHDWPHLQIILKDIKKNKLLAEQEYSRIEKDTYLNLLVDQVFTEFSEVQKLWNKVPFYLKQDPSILIAYAEHLARWNREYEAEELIRKELKKQDSPKLMEYYITISSKEPAKQVALGEKYLKGHTEDAASLRAMGLLCLRNHLWGQARDYLERSLKKEIVPQIYSTLGYVYEKLGENEKALSYYRKGMKNLAPHRLS